MRRLLTPAAALLALAALSTRVAAHVGGLSRAADTGGVPSWLTVVTGGVIIGASFLFTSLLTDRDAIREVHAWGLRVAPGAGTGPTTARVTRALQWMGVAVLAATVAVGFLGPAEATTNAAILFVWVGWWAGYTMSVYLLGNTWPALNPWRALASLVPDGDAELPDRVGVWPSVVGLVGLVYVEVYANLAESPRLLVSMVLVYTAVALATTARYGSAAWYERVDPISRVFRWYGRMAPFQRTDEGVAFRLPTTVLTEQGAVSDDGETAFVVALLWVTTYDGLVSTPVWAEFARAVVGVGVPPSLVYLAVIVAGFALFYWVYLLAARKSREVADSYVTVSYLKRWFAPSLVPIAAGYHVAHYAGYFISLAPATATVMASPLSPPASLPVVTVPGWFGAVELSFVLVGHILAVWVAHALSFDVFPGVLKAIRSQYPFIVVMIFYTMTSMWIIGQPFSPPPYT